MFSPRALQARALLGAACLCLFLGSAFAFQPAGLSSPSFDRRVLARSTTVVKESPSRYHSPIVALSPRKPGKGGGGAVLEKSQVRTDLKQAPPERKQITELKKQEQEKKTDKYAVVLIGDKEYDQGHVIGVLCKAIPGLGAMKALAAFQEAQTSGKAIVIICDEEQAEFLAEKIQRNKPPVVCDVEPLQKGL
jgi:ATP-dependent Clp protease adapter protein ClpS